MKRSFLSIVILLFLTIPAVSATATSSSSLARWVPQASKFVFGLEITKLKQSFLFTEAMSILRKEASGKTTLTFVLNSNAISFERNVTSMVVAFESPIMNPQARKTPPSAVVITGKLDKAAVIADASKHFGTLKPVTKGALEVYTGSGVELAFVDDTTLVLADQGKFADASWAAAADEAKSGAQSPDLKELMGLVDTTEGVWVVVLTKGIRPPAAAAAQMGEAPPEMDGAAISLAIANGLAATFKSQFAKPSDAEKALTQLNSIKSTSGSDPLIDLVGAKPLVQNMKASVERKRVLAVSTSISNKDLKTMFERIKSMTEKPPTIEGRDPAPSTKAKPDGAPAAPSKGSGVNADFN